MSEKSVFETLSAIDCNGKIEKKNGFSYLSWVFAWGELKKRYPSATYRVYENEHGWNYFHDGKTAWVKTGVTVEGIEHIEYLPVMDFRNKSIPLESITSFDVNKAIQRSLTKACARHGLGLYIYAGEDLPEGEEGQPKPQLQKQQKPNQPQPPKEELTPEKQEYLNLIDSKHSDGTPVFDKNQRQQYCDSVKTGKMTLKDCITSMKIFLSSNLH